MADITATLSLQRLCSQSSHLLVCNHVCFACHTGRRAISVVPVHAGECVAVSGAPGLALPRLQLLEWSGCAAWGGASQGATTSPLHTQTPQALHSTTDTSRGHGGTCCFDSLSHRTRLRFDHGGKRSERRRMPWPLRRPPLMGGAARCPSASWCARTCGQQVMGTLSSTRESRCGLWLFSPFPAMLSPIVWSLDTLTNGHAFALKTPPLPVLAAGVQLAHVLHPKVRHAGH